MRTENTPATASGDDPFSVAETRDDATTATDGAISATGTGAGSERPTGPVWDALTANPGASVAAIAAAADLTKSAARRALTELETGGHATRTAGGRDGGKRAPDAWYPAPTATATPTADHTDATDTDGADTNGATDADLEAVPDTCTAEPTTEPMADGDDGGAPEEGLDAAAVADARAVLTALGESIISAVDALITGDRTAALTDAQTIYAQSGKARRLIRTAAKGHPRTSSGKTKILPGQLQTKVAEHLAAYPTAELTPYEIGKAIGHSAGAIANALDRLVELGQAAEVCERPRRFTSAADTATDLGAATGSSVTSSR